MLDIKIKAQPDDQSCGPTSLHAMYRYFGDPIKLEQVIREIIFLETGGTLAVVLGTHALKRGYNATLYTYDLNLIDPVWLELPSEEIIKRLKMQAKYKKSKKMLIATRSYLDFLEMGGKLTSRELSPNLLKDYFKKRLPILAGLSATYLYSSRREYSNKPYHLKSIYDDIRGHPCGHFVVLCGYDNKHKKVVVADPYRKNPVSGNNYYSVGISRLLNAILLGALTYDANLLVIEPKDNSTWKQ